MSNIGEEPPKKSWLIILERLDGSMSQRTVCTDGDSLSIASKHAEDDAGSMWWAIAGRLIR